MNRRDNTSSLFPFVATAVCSWLLIWPGVLAAYEQATHAAMTREAYVQSFLNPSVSNLLARLGLDETAEKLGPLYLDIANSSTVVRFASPSSPSNFSEKKITEANGSSAFKPALPSLTAWIMLGAIREDDGPFDVGALENTPQDEPDGAFTRVFNHFFDPYLDRPLVVGGPFGARAPDWALVVPTAGTRNHFTVSAGREAMWRALTLKQIASGGILTDVPFPPSFGIVADDLRYREALRTAYWATTFRALGDVAHLLQDMAQPQHTRNDPHAGLGCNFVGCLGGHASYFERYADARATGARGFTLRERFFRSASVSDIAEPVAANPLNYAGYPIPRFNGYRDYFATALGASSTSGLGLANYSNQGFYSTGTNIHSGAEDYPSPPPTGAGLTPAVLPAGTVKNANGDSVRGALTLWKGPVADSAYPERSELNVSLSSRGAFDQFLAPGSRRYALNHYNYDDQARLLIARATAYSAGLIDYFFRGAMEISLPDAGIYGILDDARFVPPAPNNTLDFKGFDTIRLKLRNTTTDIAPPSGGPFVQEMPNGTLVAVVKFHRNTCYTNDLDGEITDPGQAADCRLEFEEIVVSDPILMALVPFADENHQHGIEFPFHFSKEVPINAWDVVLQVVYRGQLGAEVDAVVVTTKNISEPTFITTHNDTDHVRLNGSCYTPEVIAARTDLWNQLTPACRDNNTHKVADLCANVPFGVRYTTDHPPLIIAMDALAAGDQRIPPRRFARFAVLGEVADPVRFALDINSPALVQPSGYPKPISFRTDNTQADTATAGVFGAHRGIKNWDGTIFIIDGTTGAAVYPDCAEDQFDALRDAERYPTPLNISGWNDPP